MHTPTEIAQAIRKDGYPQIQNMYVRFGESGKILGACALGQAALNLHTDGDYICADLNKAWKGLCPEVDNENIDIYCPKFIQDPYDTARHGTPCVRGLGDTVIHLNDDHTWTIEQIADFVDSKVGATV